MPLRYSIGAFGYGSSSMNDIFHKEQIQTAHASNMFDYLSKLYSGVDLSRTTLKVDSITFPSLLRRGSSVGLMKPLNRTLSSQNTQDPNTRRLMTSKYGSVILDIDGSDDEFEEPPDNSIPSSSSDSDASSDMEDIDVFDEIPVTMEEEKEKFQSHVPLFVQDTAAVSDMAAPFKTRTRRPSLSVDRRRSLMIQKNNKLPIPVIVSRPIDEAPDVYCNAVVEYLQEQLSSVFLSTDQLLLILQLFAEGNIRKSAYGSYRVELIVLLFSRILDVQHMNRVLNALTAEEFACIVYRLGYLNLLCPEKLEGSYVLDLSRPEERQVARMIIHLNFTETKFHTTTGKDSDSTRDTKDVSVHLSEESFTFASSHGKSMPGWRLNVLWYSESGLPKQGILRLKYTSGDGIHVNGCKVDWTLRRMMSNLCLANIFDEEYDKFMLFNAIQFKSLKDLKSIAMLMKDEEAVVLPTLFLHEPNELRSIVTNQLLAKVTSGFNVEYEGEYNASFTLQQLYDHLKQQTSISWLYN